MNDRQDLRFKILEYLDKNGSSTEEILCSDFFSTAHHDLGTIKRTLIELIVKGYINESNVDWTTEKETKSVIFKINTSSPASDAPEKDPRRLLNRSDIPENSTLPNS